MKKYKIIDSCGNASKQIINISNETEKDESIDAIVKNIFIELADEIRSQDNNFNEVLVEHGFAECIDTLDKYYDYVTFGYDEANGRKHYSTQRAWVTGKHWFKNGFQKWYYKSGKLMAEKFYVCNILNGVVKEYYESGELKWETSYKNGRRYGIEISYHKSGKKLNTTFNNDNQPNRSQNEYTRSFWFPESSWKRNFKKFHGESYSLYWYHLETGDDYRSCTYVENPRNFVKRNNPNLHSTSEIKTLKSSIEMTIKNN